MPTKLLVAASFHRQVIVVFICVPASLPRAYSRPGEQLAACWCWMSCVDVELVSLPVVLDRVSTDYCGFYCGVFGLITTRYLNCLLQFICKAFTPPHTTSLTMARGSSPQSPSRRVFMIFLVYCVVFHCLIVQLYDVVVLSSGPTQYISYSYGTIWPICPESAVKHQLTN